MTEQLNKGVAAPTVDLNKIVDEGHLKGIVNWKETLGSINAINHGTDLRLHTVREHEETPEHGHYWSYLHRGPLCEEVLEACWIKDRS